ncbi:hypothetical protein BFW01_g7016 [Lasiodiplodia theobromae]|uniref:Uncharacterized protein n=1 Tax=Lasiodiplodia theobromae TaxID=45133 RepID=A0A5N5DCS1_9PEZI|nr:hypothetical protein DBV05_g5713 [Lasiodiplodia theobromae]KAF9636121.1 hypothetical protein BFW01_g7016 [Lasiodiplodia theobromae]
MRQSPAAPIQHLRDVDVSLEAQETLDGRNLRSCTLWLPGSFSSPRFTLLLSSSLGSRIGLSSACVLPLSAIIGSSIHDRLLRSGRALSSASVLGSAGILSRAISLCGASTFGRGSALST